MPAQRQPWFASLCFALSAEAFWGAVKFGGGWAYAYGTAAVFGVALGIAFLTTGRRIRR